jgi:copper(I)-binding protein
MSKTLTSILAILAVAKFMASVPAHAHESASHEVTITHPWAMAADAGSNTRLYMVIENGEPANITVTTLETPVASDTEIRFQADDETVLSLSSRSIRPDEALNMGTHHMWFELIGLKRDLVMGSQFPAALRLADGRHINLKVFVGHAHQTTSPDG